MKELKDMHEIDIDKNSLSRTLNSICGLSFRKTLNIHPSANNAENIQKRREFSKKLLGVYMDKKIVINIDESSINSSYYKKYHWLKKGNTRNIAMNNKVFPTSMIAAAFSDGSLMIVLHQERTNQLVFISFIEKFTEHMDNHRPDWRINHIIMIDNASYHKTKLVQDTFLRLAIPMMFTAPYSFDASPIELVFAQIKQGDWKAEGL
jgi:transposase